MSTFALWRLFHRPGLRGSAGHTSMLAIIAFAAATTIFLTVLGGVHGFIWRASADHTVACAFDFGACRPDTVAAWKRQISDPTSLAQFSTAYVALAVFACMLLVVPFVALAGSAARLAASRRDARLAALRLAGATTGQVVRLTALDAAGQALIGALIGIAGYCALMPAVMLIPFQEQRFTFEQLWVGPLALVITLAGVAILALISSLVTLRRVAITPLGCHLAHRHRIALRHPYGAVRGSRGGGHDRLQEPGHAGSGRPGGDVRRDHRFHAAVLRAGESYRHVGDHRSRQGQGQAPQGMRPR